MDDISRIKERIRKLLALSKSCNENEAALAVKKADELMEKYRLAGDDLVEYTAQKIKYVKRYTSWRAVLANAAECLYATYHVASSYDGTLIFFGDELDVFMATEVYRYLEEAVRRLARSNIRKNAGFRYRQSWKHGCASRIYDRMMELGKKCSWRSPDAMKEQKRAVAAYVNNKITSVSRSRKKVSLDMNAFTKGMAAGDGVSLGRQVENPGKRQIPELTFC